MEFEKIHNYIENLYKNDNDMNRKAFIEGTELKDFIPVVDDDVARTLKLIINMLKPKKILEIGTSIGFSASSMAREVKEYGGRIITIEYDERAAKQAEQNFKKQGLDNIVEIKVGDAKEIIPNLYGEFDMIFQDVDKRLYPVLFQECLRLLKKGGILAAEDTLFPVLDLDDKWHNLIEPIEQFNNLVVNCKHLKSTLLPIGDGLIVAIKK